MSDAPVSISTRDGVRTITVQRPEKLNALNRQTLEALDAAFAAAAQAEEVRVVVLTGAGAKAFVAGADIAEMNGLSPVQGRDFSLLGQRLMRRIERLPKPVIAMVNGFALGGGLELAMACHLRIAADILKEQHTPGEDWLLAVGRYHRPAGGAPAARYRRSVSQYLQRVLGPQQTAAHAPRQENSR